MTGVSPDPVDDGPHAPAGDRAGTGADAVLASGSLPGEDRLDASLRPRRLAQFVGQPRVRRQLDVVIRGANLRELPVDHLLFSGPPGLGKTSLAAIVANEVGSLLRHTSGPALERPGDLAAILTNLEPGDVLFVDEIHRLPRTVEEVLYPAMEDFQLDIVVGKGPAARSIRLELPRFTLIGATTRTGLIATPLRDRFGYAAHLDYYGTEDLEAIVDRSAGLLEIPLTDDGAHEIARRSRGTPRIANRLLRRVRDYAEVEGDGHVDADVARAALAVFDVDEVGLDRLDRRVLEAIVVRFDSGPVGLATLATSVGEETDTVEDTVEPFLLQLGFIQRTPRGRIATPAGRSHVDADPRPSTLFDPTR